MASNTSRTSPRHSNTSSSSIADHSSDISTSSPPHSFILIDRNKMPTTQIDMDTSDSAEDVSSVMTQVLNRMERIVEHFREKDENDAANSIAKNTISIVNIFNSTIAPWDIATAAMRPHPPGIPTAPASQKTTSSNGSHAARSTPQLKPASTTWASIAAVAPAAGNKLIKFTPKDALQKKVTEVKSETPIADTDSDQRVVWIRGWSAEQPLSEITDRIGHGPIYSMAYSEKDSAVCIIFQYGYSAYALCADDQQFTKQHKHSRFGPGCDVVEGLPFPNNDDLRRMLPPHNERRRLTFARSQLFTHGLNEDRFRNDIYSIVGERNVELVWLFNTGNATVVTTAVPLARLVRNEFIKISRSPGSPYQGVAITFSHDPCERPMTLITQMPVGRQPRPAITYGRNGVVPAGIMTKGGSSGHRGTVSEVDGWQTVNRRR